MNTITVPIKSIGYNVGTIGYLRAGLTSGALRLSEGKLKSNGNHGLWLEGDNRTQFLAAFNRYNLRLNDCPNVDTYETANASEDRNPIWTDAAWAALMDIAQKWCDERNEARDADVEQETVTATV